MLTASQTYSFLYDAKLKSTQILIGDGIIQYADDTTHTKLVPLTCPRDVCIACSFKPKPVLALTQAQVSGGAADVRDGGLDGPRQDGRQH
jgi:hypothetical protein